MFDWDLLLWILLLFDSSTVGCILVFMGCFVHLVGVPNMLLIWSFRFFVVLAKWI